MSGLLRIRWAVVPEIAPRPLINCNRCGGVIPYRCGGKFRVNANGKRIDAWLIYRCTGCDNSWNFSILERRNRRDIAPALLMALESNDPTLVRCHAFDAAALRKQIGRIEEFSDVTVQRQLLDGRPECASALMLELRLDAATPLRLDRLLAGELGISRSRLQAWQERQSLAIEPDGAKVLRRPARDGMAIRIDLAGEADRDAILSAACG
ncbi:MULTISPECIES: DUF1062 domain-containing protein [unclassified Mesorhizobium]|uniref:DUF1062 domain-containing protein n=2 Tax=Mesorhizobium TaxID=68287 RepID=UPI000FCB0BC5|nr:MULTISPECIES: DUF1062 domain-containing protein [unclassified Mesorhizobium]TGP22160.1 DUF1062 domain-containing protein [Mesorhizobium sp. M1D.F.Ca.ET.231.01.1.1]TGP30546.1 DUF1062 domain-containing protein [Mesorhizobium sp. M1D.F.Ca.ET.234.01.1.1]TGS44621.1 DUF1062 domain-containing protein [Mesorhizobium sp. M1D.F.Ca.ET.184.01.1.1]TGS60661.1 DUF1062 domain-containing protein [Mesorhizobium sp. M1D.F.Ca.ET.183.01.1.1]